MKHIMLFILSVVWIASCDLNLIPAANENTDPACSYEDPLEDIAWLKEKKQALEMRMSIAGWQIIQYKYHDAFVFYIDECFQCPDALSYVYNCEGEILCEFGGIDGRVTCPDFEREATDSTLLADGVQH